MGNVARAPISFILLSTLHSLLTKNRYIRCIASSSIFLYSLQHVEIKKSRSQSFALYSCGSAQLANHWHHLACVCVRTSQPGSCRIFAKKHKRGCKIAAGFRATFLGEKFAKVQMHCQHFLRFSTLSRFSPILSFLIVL